MGESLAEWKEHCLPLRRGGRTIFAKYSGSRGFLGEEGWDKYSQLDQSYQVHRLLYAPEAEAGPS
jgi:hypothetical protein